MNNLRLRGLVKRGNISNRSRFLLVRAGVLELQLGQISGKRLQTALRGAISHGPPLGLPHVLNCCLGVGHN